MLSFKSLRRFYGTFFRTDQLSWLCTKLNLRFRNIIRFFYQKLTLLYFGKFKLSLYSFANQQMTNLKKPSKIRLLGLISIIKGIKNKKKTWMPGRFCPPGGTRPCLQIRKWWRDVFKTEEDVKFFKTIIFNRHDNKGFLPLIFHIIIVLFPNPLNKY